MSESYLYHWCKDCHTHHKQNDHTTKGDKE